MVVSQPQAIGGVERRLARDRTEASIERLGADRIIVGFVLQAGELGREPWLFWMDGVMVGQCRLAPDSSVLLVVVLLGSGTGDRPDRCRRTWARDGKLAPVISVWDGSAAGSSRAGGR